MPRDSRALIGVIPDPELGRELGRRALMARIDGTADLNPGLTDDERAERIRQARSRHFAELGRASARARSARRATADVIAGSQHNDLAVVPDGAVAPGGGDRRDRAAG